MSKLDPSQCAAIIVAAGRGTRAGGGVPKQWRPLAGKRVVDHTLAAFQRAGVSRIVLVLNADDHDQHEEFARAGYVLATGGTTRSASVRAGLEALSDDPPSHVLIHDVARPCVPVEVIHGVIDALNIRQGAAPALPVTDALWRGEKDLVAGTAARDGLFRAQTPQGFAFDAITAANARGQDAADDVEIARNAGIDVAITPGSEDNLKITTVADFARAEAILRGSMKVRTGNGFDVHAFGPGDHVTLCGVKIPYDQGLVGHSDADVSMHTVTDAIYGALAMGDIGQHFPPSDPQWKGAASDIFLRHAVDLAAQHGFEISNIDCTIICEMPKIGPHAHKMRNRMAEIMGLDPADISVKATTSERLGFAGRGEGIACIATCTLVGA
jgi:2-C-methyl-D-erythritol 4-phosphate cytidylyltransferase/2-C-methyl-D-erythritol 2,4-cyclodiphosphate synthase